MELKIGFQKDYLLPSGYTANFWAVGQRVFLFDENSQTDFTSPKQVKVELVLYKDLTAFMNSLSTGIKQTFLLDYLITDLLGTVNLIDKCFNDIKNNTVNTYFNDAEIITTTINE